MPNDFSVRTGVTTSQQIENYLTNNVSQDRKILARSGERGEIILYEKPKSSGVLGKVGALFDRAIGRTDRREQRAVDLISSSLNSILETKRSSLKESLIDRINNQIDIRRSAGTMNASFLAGVMVAARALPNTIAEPSNASGQPTFHSLGMRADDPIISHVARAISAGGNQAQAAMKLLGDTILQKFNNTGPSVSDREAFALSDGVTLTKELQSAIKAELQKIDPDRAADKLPMLDKLAAAYFSAAARATLDGPVGPTSMTTITWITEQHGPRFPHQATLPNVRIGGEEYKAIGFLGSGGFADVYKYEAVNDPGKQIAVKITKDLGMMPEGSTNEYSSTVQSASEEVALHRAAYGNGCNEIVKIEGAMRLADGNFAVAMELAPNDTVYTMSDTLAKAVAAGDLTPAEANILRLTMLKDMVRGLAHMHDNQNVTHYDFKAPNCFIGKDGTVKVGDFGMTQQMDGAKALDSIQQKADNPIFKAPELHRGEKLMGAIKDLADETVKRIGKSFVEKMKAILPSNAKNDDLVIALTRNVHADEINQVEFQARSDAGMVVFDRAVDIWGLGASALELLTGKGIGHGIQFLTQVSDMIAKYGTNRSNVALSDPGPDGKPKPGSLGLKTGNAALDNLLNRMLAPDPRDRATASQLLGDPAFQAVGGVDSKEARNLIVAMKSGDKQKIAEARQALAALAPEPEDIKEPETPELNDETPVQWLEDLADSEDNFPPLPPTPNDMKEATTLDQTGETPVQWLEDMIDSDDDLPPLPPTPSPDANGGRN